MKKCRLIAVFMLIAMLTVALNGCMTLNIELPLTSPVTVSGENNNTAAANPPATAAQTTPDIQTTAAQEQSTADSTVAQTEPAAQQPSDEPEAPTQAPATQAPATQAVSNDPLSYNNEQLLSWFNESLNKVKTQKAGFTKSKVTTIPELSLTNSLANSVSDMVVGMLVKGEPEVTSVAKGESSDAIMSPSSQSYVSALTAADIASISVVQSGSNYVVTVNVKDEVNPDKSNSAYGRVFDYLSKGDLIDVYIKKLNDSGTLTATLPAENCTVSMSGGTAVAEITPDGQIVKYETRLQGAIDVTECSVKVLVTLSTGFNCVLKSVTTYTDFVW